MNEMLVEKIFTGVSLTDEELDLAVLFYRELERHLVVLRPRFDLAWFEVNRTLSKLESYQFHRQSVS